MEAEPLVAPSTAADGGAGVQAPLAGVAEHGGALGPAETAQGPRAASLLDAGERAEGGGVISDQLPRVPAQGTMAEPAMAEGDAGVAGAGASAAAQASARCGPPAVAPAAASVDGARAAPFATGRPDLNTCEPFAVATTAGAVELEQPSLPEQQHKQKPQWRRGVEANGRTAYLMVTLSPSDVTTKRLRPPRSWHDALLGPGNLLFAACAEFEGVPVTFLLTAFSYSYIQ